MGGSEEEEEHPSFFGGAVCWVWVAPFELILLPTSVDWLFCLGPRETITTSTVETLYSYPEKQLLLVHWIQYHFWLLLGHRNVSLY